MGKKSRPTSGRKSAAAPVPIKADPPPTVRPSAAQESAIESQVESLLDQAEQQVQTMTELVNESAPEPTPQDPASPTAEAPVAPESAPPEPQLQSHTVAADDAEQNQATTDDSMDSAALQNQVDAILAQAGHHIDPTPEPPQTPVGVTSEPDSDTDSDAGADTEATATQVETQVAPPGESADADLETDQLDQKADIDIATVDAVIADAAQRAMEEDDFGSDLDGGPAVDTQSIDPPVSAPAASADSAPATAPQAPKREPVIKGGDASMRREKPKNRPQALDGDLDGGSRATPAAARDSIASDDDQSLLSSQGVEDDPRLRSRIVRFTFRQLAAMNAPWYSWTKQTRYAVLGITFLNLVLATVAYFILLRRWI